MNLVLLLHFMHASFSMLSWSRPYLPFQWKPTKLVYPRVLSWVMRHSAMCRTVGDLILVTHNGARAEGCFGIVVLPQP